MTGMAKNTIAMNIIESDGECYKTVFHIAKKIAHNYSVLH